MRTARPLVTCSKIKERLLSAMPLSISTPRFTGPGCTLNASGLVLQRRSEKSGEPSAPITGTPFHVHHRHDPDVFRLFQEDEGVGKIAA